MTVTQISRSRIVRREEVREKCRGVEEEIKDMGFFTDAYR